MTFGQPNYLYLLMLVPLVVLFVLWAVGRRRASMARLGDPTLVDQLSITVNWQGRRWRLHFWIVRIGSLEPEIHVRPRVRCITIGR